MVVVIFDVQGEGEVDEKVGEREVFQMEQLIQEIFFVLSLSKSSSTNLRFTTTCIQNLYPKQ